MLHCKDCDCVIVPGRAGFINGNYYCRRCMGKHTQTKTEHIPITFPAQNREGGSIHVKM